MKHPWKFDWMGKHIAVAPSSDLFPSVSGSGTGVVFYSSEHFPKNIVIITSQQTGPTIVFFYTIQNGLEHYKYQQKLNEKLSMEAPLKVVIQVIKAQKGDHFFAQQISKSVLTALYILTAGGLSTGQHMFRKKNGQLRKTPNTKDAYLGLHTKVLH